MFQQVVSYDSYRPAIAPAFFMGGAVLALLAVPSLLHFSHALVDFAVQQVLSYISYRLTLTPSATPLA